MAYLLLFLILLIVAIWLVWTVTSSVVGLIVMLVVAGIIGWLADLIVPGKLPFGWLGAIVAGLLGSFIGWLLFRGWGPSLAGISIIPALIGAIIVAFIASLLFKATAGPRTS